jgi:hypothetical protein
VSGLNGRIALRGCSPTPSSCKLAFFTAKHTRLKEKPETIRVFFFFSFSFRRLQGRFLTFHVYKICQTSSAAYRNLSSFFLSQIVVSPYLCTHFSLICSQISGLPDVQNSLGRHWLLGKRLALEGDFSYCIPINKRERECENSRNKRKPKKRRVWDICVYIHACVALASRRGRVTSSTPCVS